jgi:tRNA(Ile2) C34 agmatinyltransferase TiaS
MVAVVLATAGLFLLYMTAKHREPPLVSISEITPVMNFAHIRIEGEVRKKPYIGRDNEYLSFRVFDDSGSLQVVAYRETAKKLITENGLPHAGDRVDVRGNLSSSAAKAKLYLKIPQHLTIKPAVSEVEQ